MKWCIFFLLVIAFVSCTSKKECNGTILKPSPAFIDSVKTASDSSYEKKYRNSEFVTAIYFLNRKDSSVCQIMKDSAGTIRQMIITLKGVRKFTGEYYETGQIKTQYSLDDQGRFHGVAYSYSPKGCLMSKGSYEHGFRKGEWQHFDFSGKIVSTEVYDSTGQLIRSSISDQ